MESPLHFLLNFSVLALCVRQQRPQWAASCPPHHNLKQMAATVTAYQQYGFSSPEELDEACSAAYAASTSFGRFWVAIKCRVFEFCGSVTEVKDFQMPFAFIFSMTIPGFHV